MADEVSFAYRGAGSEAEPLRPADWAGLAGAGLIGVGIAGDLIDTFLTYTYEPGQNRADLVTVVLTTVLSAGVLAASAGLVVAGSWPAAASARPDSRSRRKAYGALLGAGMRAVCFGNEISALCGVTTGLYRHVPYLLLGLIWWLPVAAGSALSLGRKGSLASAGRPGRPHRTDVLALALLASTVIGAMVTWALPWDRYTFTAAATGAVHTEVLYNAFTAPGAVLAGDVGDMIVMLAMAVAATLWRPARFGAVFLTAAVLALAEEAMTGISSVIVVPSPAAFGVPQAQAAAARLTITVAGTPWLWAYCGFAAVLIVLYEWLFTRSRPRRQLTAAPVTSAESALP